MFRRVQSKSYFCVASQEMRGAGISILALLFVLDFRYEELVYSVEANVSTEKAGIK